MPNNSSEISDALFSGWIVTWPTRLLALIWLAWVVSWVVASFWSGRTKSHVRTWDSWFYRLPILIGAILLSRARRGKLANYWVERLKISALQRKAKIVELSGGNQQKVVLAKTLVQEPSIVILDEPTRGVDVGTIPHIHAEIRRLADEGKAVVVISSYLPEILAVADRILVARTGRIVAEFDAADATQDKILYAAVH